MSEFREIAPAALEGNVFRRIGEQWMLVTAGEKTGFNTMTASWGGLGVLWGKNVAFCFIRPQRYTFEFLERNDRFTLSFYGEEMRDALNLCGSKSGRDVDKAKLAGLTPVFSDGTVYFREASAVLICRKMYYQDFDPKNFLDKSIFQNYKNRDYHRMYVGGIEKLLMK